MKDFSIKAIYGRQVHKGITLEFDVEAENIEAALEEGTEIALMVFQQTLGDLKKSEIYIEVCTKN